jgi:hypothetical protein
MSNKKIWLGMLVMALVFGMTVVGCEDDSGGGNNGGGSGGGGGITWTFNNLSSVSVTITCSALNPSEFFVNAGSQKSATSTELDIDFIYTPANQVNLSRDGRTYTFRNK